MKPFEVAYCCARPFMPALHQQVRSRLLELSSASGSSASVLDVGGRKSHYTIGVPARITISDLPRESDVQKRLHLGLTTPVANQLVERRSNLERVVFDDMTCSKLPDASFDCVVAVEVLEHVAEDRKFVSEVRRVLRPGGVFLMTTPNGDFVTNHNPDHKRHYTREDLHSLLAEYLGDVNVEYAVNGGTLYSLGLRSWSLRHPMRTAVTMAAAFLNNAQSKNHGIQGRAQGTQKLIAAGRRLD